MRALAQHRLGKVEAMAHGGLHQTAMLLIKGMDDLSHKAPNFLTLRTNRNRIHRVCAKHGRFGQTQENLLQGHGLSVSNCNAMTYSLPPLNALRAFEAAARHLSFKLAAHELHVTPAAVGQQVKALEARLGVCLFERLHKQLILTAAGQAYLPGISDGFRRIADATSQLKPAGAVLLQLGVHGGFDLRRLALAEFRSTHAETGLRVLQPAGLHELVEGKVDLLIERGLGHHPGYRCDWVNKGSGLGDWLIVPEGTADCPEVVSFREWLGECPIQPPPTN
jgi:LysR family transcriptional regulator, glycine cleavage system transcriptional activator